MLYWKFSPNRVFFLNEYWILVPTAVFVNYLVIRQIRSRKKQMEELKILREQIEQYKNQQKLRRIIYLAGGVSVFSYISMCRGGTDFIDVDYIDCGIEEGLRYLDNDRLGKIVHDLYKQKRKGKIIYITATALSHVAHQYGQEFLALPFAIGDFGLTNVYQTIRKVVVTILLGGVGPLYVVGGAPALIAGSLLTILGLRLAFTNPDKILTSPVLEMSSTLKPRIPDVPDVVSVNCRDKIALSNPVQEKGECWLPGQPLLNPNCRLKGAEIPSIIDQVDLKYDDVVNMQDVTGLDRVAFSDISQLGQAEPSIPKPSGKTVNFLEKFGDPDTVSKSETWDIHDSTATGRRVLRSRIRN